MRFFLKYRFYAKKKKYENMSKFFLIIFVGIPHFCRDFVESKLFSWWSRSSLLTVWNEKNTEEFVFSLIFNMLGCWETFLIAFSTSYLSGSTLQGRSIWRLSTIFSKWSLNSFITSFISLITSFIISFISLITSNIFLF